MPEISEGKPSYRTLTPKELERLPDQEFCDAMESILSDPIRNESLIRMMAVSDRDLEDIVKNLRRVVEAMRFFGR